MKTIFNLLFLLLPAFSFAQIIEATLVNNWDDEDIIPAFFNNPYHDVWGTTINGVEYGAISTTEGFYFFNVSGDGSNMEPVAFAGGTDTGSNISHRDIKVYQNYLIAVADEGASALQIFDLSVLPDDPVLVYESNEFVARCHNIYIDEPNDRLYMVGGNGFNLRIVSLEDPANPTLLASFPNANLNIPYIHDLYVRDNIGYLNAAFTGLMVVDFTDPENSTLLGTMTDYIQQGYNHSGWLSDDGDYYYLCDETHGTDIKVVDVSDFSDIHVVSTTNAASTQNQIVHNVYLQGNLLFASYYYDGLQVFDVSNPDFPRRVAYYDTSEEINTSYFAGAWGIFVLPSGRALISDMQNGFYVFEPLELEPNTFVTPGIPQLETCIDEYIEFDAWVGPEFEGSTVTLSVENSDPSLDVQLSTTELAPGDVLNISVTGNSSGIYDMVISATDGNITSESVIPVAVAAFPAPANLVVPTDEKENVSLTPLFLWNGISPESIINRLEISTSEDEFDDNIVHSQTATGGSIILSFELEEGTTYYWRIVSTFDCGDNPSETFSFTTRIISSTGELAGNSFNIAPNPVSETLYLNFDAALEEDLVVNLLSPEGKLLKSMELNSGITNTTIDTNTFSKGIYFLKLSSKTATTTKIIVIQ